MANLNNFSHKDECKYVCEIIPTYRKTEFKKRKINAVKGAVKFIRKILSPDVIPHYEVFGALFLDRNSCLMGYNIIHKGGIEKIHVDIRLLLQNALICNATRIIVFHNHPSGDVNASNSDTQITNHILEACAVLNIKLLDSIIITETKSAGILIQRYEK